MNKVIQVSFWKSIWKNSCHMYKNLFLRIEQKQLKFFNCFFAPSPKTAWKINYLQLLLLFSLLLFLFWLFWLFFWLLLLFLLFLLFFSDIKKHLPFFYYKYFVHSKRNLYIKTNFRFSTQWKLLENLKIPIFI